MREGKCAERDSPAPKASGCPRAKPEPRSGRKRPSEGNFAVGEPVGRAAVARGRGSFAAASLPSSGPASVRDPRPSAGKENQSKAKSAAVKRLVRGRLQEVPRCDARPRQNCSARQFSELSSAALSRPTPRHRRPSQHHQRGQPPASPRRGNVPMDRGRRPPEAENRAHIPRAIASREAMLWQGCSFSASLLSRKAPRSVLGGVSRPRRPRSRGKSVRNAKHTSTADEHTLKGDPRPMARARATLGRVRHNLIGRGGGSPKGNRWRNADARPNAPAPRGNAQFSRLWGLLSHSPLGAGVIRKLLLSGKSVSPLRAVDEEGCA